MLYELTPDTKVTGDLFYSEQEFDTEFTDLMFNKTLNVLETKAKEAANNNPLLQRRQSYATVQEILANILSSKLFTVNTCVFILGIGIFFFFFFIFCMLLTFFLTVSA